jgi:hypothetical protein
MDVYKYAVTELAGPVVANIRVSKGDEIELTELQAQAELLQGTLVKKGDDLHEAFTKPCKIMNSLNEEAQAFKTRNLPVIEPVLLPVPAVAAPVLETKQETKQFTKPVALPALQASV